MFRRVPEGSFLFYGLFTKGCLHGSSRWSNSTRGVSPVQQGRGYVTGIQWAVNKTSTEYPFCGISTSQVTSGILTVHRYTEPTFRIPTPQTWHRVSLLSSCLKCIISICYFRNRRPRLNTPLSYASLYLPWKYFGRRHPHPHCQT